jgi:hypothetical protein
MVSFKDPAFYSLDHGVSLTVQRKRLGVDQS